MDYKLITDTVNHQWY